jgi:excisionase family DNA binding protein
MTDDGQAANRDEVLTPEELAAFLKIGRTSAYALLANRAIESFTIGRRRLIMRSAIDRFLTERANNSQE